MSLFRLLWNCFALTLTRCNLIRSLVPFEMTLNSAASGPARTPSFEYARSSSWPVQLSNLWRSEGNGGVPFARGLTSAGQGNLGCCTTAAS